MDSGNVAMIISVQETIDSYEGEQDKSDEIWAGKDWLDPRLVREGRLNELKRLQHFDVYEVVDESEATGHVVDAKWVDRQKGSVVRSRIVARQFATKSLETLVRWDARRHNSQGHIVESGHGQGQGAVRGRR